MKEILKAAINKVTKAVPDTNQKIVEKDLQEKFDDAKQELDLNTENTISKKPKLVEITPIGSTENSTPFYIFSSTYAGTISYSGSCSSSMTQALQGENTIQLNSLSVGTYSNCSLTVTYSEGQTSMPLNISAFTIIAKITDTTAPALAIITAVDEFSATNSPALVFYSTEAGKIKITSDCQSQQQNAVKGANSMFSFTNLAVGT